MPKYLAIDVGSRQIRYLLAEVAGKKVQVFGYGVLDVRDQNAESVKQSSPGDELPTSAKGSKTDSPRKSEDDREVLAERLAAELAKIGGSGLRTIAAVARADVDIRRFTLPPASDDELAELVAVQVLSDAGGAGDGGVVDFVTQPTLPTGERPVEAVVATGKLLESYKALGQRAGVKLRRLVLRPYASASLLRYFKAQGIPAQGIPARGAQAQGKTGAQAAETVLLIDRIGTEVDLIATSDGQVLLWRTMQLDGESDTSQVAEGLISEIVRIVAIAPTHLAAGRTIERIQLLGCEAEYEHLAAELAGQTRLPVEILDPVSLASVSVDLRRDAGSKDLKENEAERELGDGAAPLLGMLLDEANETAPSLDLLNPRKPPPPKNYKRVALLATIAGVVLLYLAGTWLQELHADLEQKNATLTSKLLELRKQGKKLSPQFVLARSIATWESEGIVWLDELRDLTGKFPSAEDMTVRGMTISSLRGGGARIRVTGQVRDPAVIVKMDHDLRDKYRNATSTNFREQGTKGEPSWRFETVITTRRRSAEDYLAHSSSTRKLPGEPAIPNRASRDPSSTDLPLGSVVAKGKSP